MAQDHAKGVEISKGRYQEEGVLEAMAESQKGPKNAASAGLLLLGRAVWLGNGLDQAA